MQYMYEQEKGEWHRPDSNG